MKYEKRDVIIAIIHFLKLNHKYAYYLICFLFAELQNKSISFEFLAK